MVMLPVLFFFSWCMKFEAIRTAMAPPCVQATLDMNLDRAKWTLFWELMKLYDKHTAPPYKALLFAKIQSTMLMSVVAF